MNENIKIPNLPSNECFACGPINPIGLKLKFESDGSTVFTKKFISKEFAGWERLVHGGILSTISDETIAWTGIYLTKKYILTRGLSMEFLKPIFVEQTLTSIGKITEWVHEKEIVVSVEIIDETGEVCAKSKGNLVLFDKESIRKRNLFDENYLTEFEKSVFDII